MKQDYLSNWGTLFTKVQQPLQRMLELNIKTLQNLRYFKADELYHWQEPSKFLDHQMQITLQNGHQWLDYMRDSFYLLESMLYSAAQEFKSPSQNNMAQEIFGLGASLHNTLAKHAGSTSIKKTSQKQPASKRKLTTKEKTKNLATKSTQRGILSKSGRTAHAKAGAKNTKKTNKKEAHYGTGKNKPLTNNALERSAHGVPISENLHANKTSSAQKEKTQFGNVSSHEAKQNTPKRIN